MGKKSILRTHDSDADDLVLDSVAQDLVLVFDSEGVDLTTSLIFIYLFFFNFLYLFIFFLIFSKLFKHPEANCLIISLKTNKQTNKHSNFSMPSSFLVTDKNNIVHVLINNSRTAEPIKF